MARPIPSLGRTIRNIRRAREILSVFASYGFIDVIQELDLDRLALRGKRLVGLAEPNAEVHRLPQAVRLRHAMEQLGPTFIKMAQILSTRPDLIPEEWAREFERLQSDVPPVPAEEIRPHIEALYDGELQERFASVEFEAMAAASIAQAHRAALPDGTPVVLKVLRPGIEQVLESDVEILRALASFAESHFANLGYSPVQVVEQFARQVEREVDLELEGRSMRRMNRSFENNPNVAFPRVYMEHTREGVLCMELVEGVLLANRKPGDFTDAQRRRIVAIGSDAVFRQCFEIGFFHADPHPGNIFVVRDGARLAKPAAADGRGLITRAAAEPDSAVRALEGGPDLQLVFIDCGMTGHIEPRTAELLADLVQGTIGGDLDRVIDVVIALTDSTPALAADRAFRADAWEFISRFESATLEDLQMGALLSEFFEKIRRHRLQCPADIVYLIKAVTTIEGVGEALAPDFDIVNHVRPHLERLVRRRYGIRALRRRLEGSLVGYAELAERLPRETRDLLYMIRRGRVSINLQHQGLDRLTDEVERASRNISYALVMSSLIVGGSILFLADTAQPGPRGVLFYAGLAAVVMAGLFGVARVAFTRRP
jgi:ubiquinone biosynthesis protein